MRRRLIGREADVTRTWLGVIAVGALVAACAQPDPAVPSPAAPLETGSPPQRDAPGILPSPITDKVLPSPLDADPPYVIAPGDPAARRNAQSPQPGGRPAF